MKKTIFLFMLCIGGAVMSANAQTFMNVHHTGGINGYDTDLIPSVTFTTTDVVINGVGAPYTMSDVSKITFGADLSTGINEELLNSSVVAYPNPTSGVITLNITDNAQGTVVNIYNVAGSLVSSTTYNGNVVNEKIDLSSFDNGIYMMIINSNNTVITKKIVKN
ncbi:MAG: T9SS type A sorting domain-containing protein [Bacteroidetes bacterium]|nr:T9SS type A sorting domain-containing protein [Bacteroidota bacterium]